MFKKNVSILTARPLSGKVSTHSMLLHVLRIVSKYSVLAIML
jgi:hypothetical protein